MFWPQRQWAARVKLFMQAKRNRAEHNNTIFMGYYLFIEERFILPESSIEVQIMRM